MKKKENNKNLARGQKQNVSENRIRLKERVEKASNLCRKIRQ